MTPFHLRMAITAAVVSLAVTAPLAFAHDFWLVPNAFSLAPGAELDVRGQTSSAFPTSESAAGFRRSRQSDSVAIAEAVAAYHRALAAGDSAAALALLAPDAVILESGVVETRDEYRGHHLPADIAYARAVRSVRGPVRVVVRGDVAWATSTSTTRGTYRGRVVNSAGAELMVLSREPAGWKIRTIHWSSRTLRRKGSGGGA